MKKSKKEIILSTEQFENQLKNSLNENYLLRLYVSGSTPKSVSAIENIKKICEEYLQGHYELEVIDLYKRPNLAKGEQIIAVPTLVKKLPEPIKRIIGDLSDIERVLVGLDLRRKNDK